MRKRNIKYITGILILLLTFELNAQSKEMEPNQNRIDSNFKPTSELRTKINKQSTNKNELNLFLEKKNDSLFSIYIINNTSDTIRILKQDWQLFLIQEAKDIDGNWKPIEYWQNSSCANSYLHQKLEPKGILATESKVYNGDFRTEIRFKLMNNRKNFYSNAISSSIYLGQFNIPENISEYFIYKNILRTGGKNLLEKVIFLDPNGMSEYSEKVKAELEKAGVKH